MNFELIIAIAIWSVFIFGMAGVASVIFDYEFDRALLFVTAGVVVSIWARLIVGGVI